MRQIVLNSDTETTEVITAMSERMLAPELFRALLHRQPTDWEINYWNSELLGTSLETVIRRIATSDEHRAISADKRLMFVPAGHFYSPIVNVDFVADHKGSIFSDTRALSGIDLNEATQEAFVTYILDTGKNLPFTEEPNPRYRYFYNNNAFVYGDAVVYSSMISKYKPKRIIEIGSGYSSALLLDVCDMIDGYCPEVTFYDPYPQLVQSLIASRPRDNVTIIGKFIQDVAIDDLAELSEGDFYFMDTTHIVKTGSDVLYHFETILPKLKSGVIIHLHDIFYPFEYPSSWVLDMKLSWNELYYFRAFMTNNNEYEILFFNNYMYKTHFNRMSECSVIAKNGGASIWLRKK